VIRGALVAGASAMAAGFADPIAIASHCCRYVPVAVRDVFPAAALDG
jgi:hypothetical protein